MRSACIYKFGCTKRDVNLIKDNWLVGVNSNDAQKIVLPFNRGLNKIVGTEFDDDLSVGDTQQHNYQI